MIRLRRPTDPEIQHYLAEQDGSYSYKEVGATADERDHEALRGRYDVDRRRFLLGRGRECFERAWQATREWAPFAVPWVEFQQSGPRAEEGVVVAMLVRQFGVWFLTPCRVVYVHEGENVCQFAYGTLKGHVERGEERFRIDFDPESEEVHYEIAAFSRPAFWLTRLAYPLVRRIQRRFALDSGAAVQRASGRR